MDFIEDVRISKERAEAGFGAEIDCPASMFGAGIVSGIGIAEDPPTEGDETRMFLCFQRMFMHIKGGAGTRPLSAFCGLSFRDEDLKRIDRQSARRFGGL